MLFSIFEKYKLLKKTSSLISVNILLFLEKNELAVSLLLISLKGNYELFTTYGEINSFEMSFSTFSYLTAIFVTYQFDILSLLLLSLGLINSCKYVFL